LSDGDPIEGIDALEVENSQEEENKDFVEDYIHAPMIHVNQMSILFKVHIVVALTLCLASFFAFHFTASLLFGSKPSMVFPWWMFPWFLFTMTLTGHHFYSKGNYWTGSVIIVIVFHIAMFIINKILTPQYDWYWYTLLLSLMFGMYQYYTMLNAPKLRIYSYLYMIFSAMIFLTWLNLHDITEFPWFIYPICIGALPLMLCYIYSVYSERRWYLYGAVACADLNVMILVTWGFLDTVWPWFFVPLIMSLMIVTLWWFLYTRGWGKTYCACCCAETLEDNNHRFNAQLLYKS